MNNVNNINEQTIDIAYDVALERLEFETNYYKHIESRFTALLSGVAIVITIFVGLLDVPNLQFDNLNWFTILAVTITLLLLTSLLIFFVGLIFMRHIKSAPQPKTMMEHYLHLPPNELKYEIIKYKVSAWKETNDKLLMRVRLLKIGSGFFISSLLLIFVFIFIK